MSGLKKEAAAIRRELSRVQYGCTVTPTGGGHWKVFKPGCRPVYLANSPSDQRSIKNDKAVIKRELGIAL
jgi:hypothetical protein